MHLYEEFIIYIINIHIFKILDLDKHKLNILLIKLEIRHMNPL